MFDEPLVIDDFYSDPDRVRHHALKLQYARHTNANYAGYHAPTFQKVQPLMVRFSKILSGITLTDHEIRQGDFRVALLGTPHVQRLKVHTDPTTWTAVIYLTPGRKCGGTLFYRHKATGWTQTHWEGDQRYDDAKKAGLFKSEREMMAYFYRDTKNLGAWQIIREIPMRYNRMVLFRGTFFHSPTLEGFGKTVKSGRLSQHFFFSPKPSRECKVPDPYVQRSFALASAEKISSQKNLEFFFDGRASTTLPGDAEAERP